MKENPASGGWGHAHYWEWQENQKWLPPGSPLTQQPASLPSHRQPCPCLDHLTFYNLRNLNCKCLHPFYHYPALVTLVHCSSYY